MAVECALRNEHWWNDTDRGKQKYSEKKNLFHCHPVHHKTHTNGPQTEFMSPR